ncbi:TAXI family TRAP transporter solute-binding subunit [Duganella vulcania]|uniref:TAXI family TRAP transporter solute-binding subunit n=1 Tax=Duganella vulcania TaxID=2692166 RepID=A0A845GEK6_9BURK|nr:TAXI family TRAP transporter solute-binding subunit [Duganella vulcania]MYM92331.1 hypothetical protein [Duganella vulcania]
MKIKFALSAVLVLAMSLANAAKVDGGPSAGCEGLKVATGKAGKGYSKLYADLVKATGGQLKLCEVNSEGGLDNLDILSTKKADVGFVSVDTLKKMAEGDPNIAALQVVATLNSNFLHIVVAANGIDFQGPKKWGVMKGDVTHVQISKLSDLHDKSVALVGSAQLMVRQIDKLLNLKMQYIDVPTDEEAFKKVKSGEVMAAFTVAGWPAGPITKLTQSQGLTLVGFDMPIGSPYAIRQVSYKNVGIYNTNLVAVQNVLVTRAFTGAKIGEVGELKKAIQKSLPDLKDGDYEPGWNEISSLDAKVDWPSFFGTAVASNAGANTKKK